MTTVSHPHRAFQVALRECRLVTERILLTLGLPQGCIPAIRESIILSHAMGLGGFQHLHDIRQTLAQVGYGAMQMKEAANGGLDIDGGGIHAWLIAQTVADLAVDIARRQGSGTVRLFNISVPEELAVVEGLASRHGARAAVEIHRQAGGLATMVSRPRDLDHWDPYLADGIRHHFPVDEQLWQALYHLSNAALAPDSVVSRRHAGPVILLDDGTIVGRLPADDDFDPQMLKKAEINKINEGAVDGN